MSPGNDAGRTRAFTALTTAAAVAAVVMVLVTAAVAGQQFASHRTDSAADAHPISSDPSIRYPPGTSPTPTVFEGGRNVFGDAASNAYFEVPPGWETSQPEDIRGVEGVIDGPNPYAWGPATYDKGYCRADPEDVRAYVGLGVAVPSHDVKAANELIMKSWRAALASDAREHHLGAPVVRPPTALTLDGGETAWKSSLTSPWHPPAHTCETGRVAVSLLSIDTGANVATVTAFRYVDTGTDVPAGQIDTILESVRRRTAD